CSKPEGSDLTYTLDSEEPPYGHVALIFPTTTTSDMHIFDVRPLKEYSAGHFPGRVTAAG
ncbi:MAG: hypothetical protein ACTIA2_15380, partial [Brevibacterium aurantiacum]|uniref:hypothetical protein n=1 Tax=Brevibacterium aurantiacum TaxID=273384 RepID=UPI003F90A84E